MRQLLYVVNLPASLRDAFDLVRFGKEVASVPNGNYGCVVARALRSLKGHGDVIRDRRRHFYRLVVYHVDSGFGENVQRLRGCPQTYQRIEAVEAVVPGKRKAVCVVGCGLVKPVGIQWHSAYPKRIVEPYSESWGKRSYGNYISLSKRVPGTCSKRYGNPVSE